MTAGLDLDRIAKDWRLDVAEDPSDPDDFRILDAKPRAAGDEIWYAAHEDIGRLVAGLRESWRLADELADRAEDVLRGVSRTAPHSPPSQELRPAVAAWRKYRGAP